MTQSLPLYLQKRKIFLKISIQELLNRSSYLGIETKDFDRRLSDYVLGRRNGYIIIDLELSLCFLKKAISFVTHSFFLKPEGQSLIFDAEEKHGTFLQKIFALPLQIQKTSVASLISNLSYSMPQKKMSEFSFPEQIFFCGKWVGGLLTNWFRILTYARYVYLLQFNLFEREYKSRKLELTKTQLNTFNNPSVNKTSAAFTFFTKQNKEIKINSVLSQSDLENKKEFKFYFPTKIEEDFFEILQQKNTLEIDALFFKKTNYGLGLKIPDCVFFLSDSKYAILEAGRISIPTIGIIDPRRYLNKVDYPIYSNHSPSISLFYATIFKNAIFFGRASRLRYFCKKVRKRNFLLKSTFSFKESLDFVQTIIKSSNSVLNSF
jgi:ribosomal protein S2